MTATGDLQDNAEGLQLKISKITPLCKNAVTEVEFQSTKNPQSPKRYGYYQTDYTQMKRSGEGVKSVNPCTEISSMESFGSLKYS